MEDLFDVQVHKMDSILQDQKFVQSEDLISLAVFETSSIANQVMQAFHTQRLTGTSVDVDKLKPLLMKAVEWITVLFYCFEIDPPDLEEDVPEAVDGFETVVAIDPILSSLYIQRCLADISLDYFAHEEGMDYDETTGLLFDMVACIEMISRRLGKSLVELIMKL